MGVDVKSGVVSSTNLRTESQATNSFVRSAEASSNLKQKTVQSSNSIESLNSIENRRAKESVEEPSSPAQEKKELKEWVSKMNTTLNEKVKFTYSEDFGGIYVTVIDNDTQEVIRKIPTEDAIKLSAIWKEAVGNIFDSKG